MKWDTGVSDARLVADDGEILETVKLNYHSGAYVVQSTGKGYVGIEQAKAAAERKARSLPHD